MLSEEIKVYEEFLKKSLEKAIWGELIDILKVFPVSEEFLDKYWNRLKYQKCEWDMYQSNYRFIYPESHKGLSEDFIRKHIDDYRWYFLYFKVENENHLKWFYEKFYESITKDKDLIDSFLEYIRLKRFNSSRLYKGIKSAL